MGTGFPLLNYMTDPCLSPNLTGLVPILKWQGSHKAIVVDPLPVSGAQHVEDVVIGSAD